jgi:hypothetical protein
VSASSTAVYVATAGAIAAAVSPAGRSASDTRPRSGRGTSPFTSATAATPAGSPKPVRNHVPMLIGDVGFATRSML